MQVFQMDFYNHLKDVCQDHDLGFFFFYHVLNFTSSRLFVQVRNKK